jgi:uridylate kinase
MTAIEIASCRFIRRRAMPPGNRNLVVFALVPATRTSTDTAAALRAGQIRADALFKATKRSV